MTVVFVFGASPRDPVHAEVVVDDCDDPPAAECLLGDLAGASDDATLPLEVGRADIEDGKVVVSLTVPGRGVTFHVALDPRQAAASDRTETWVRDGEPT